jgi:hypothetical protein
MRDIIIRAEFVSFWKNIDDMESQGFQRIMSIVFGELIFFFSLSGVVYPEWSQIDS